MKGRVYTLLPLIVFAVVVSAADQRKKASKLILEHADVLEGQRLGDREIRRLKGNVKFRQDSAILTCDEAVQYLSEGRTVLSGGVRFVDSSRTLSGDQVTYEEATRVTCIEGNAELSDASHRLRALRICYDDLTEKASAEGAAELSNEKERTTIVGARIEYDRRSGYARVIGKPQMTRVDSTDGGELIISGVFFEMFEDGDRIVVSDSVRVLRGDLEARCDTLVYLRKENAVKLAHLPRVKQDRQRLTGSAVTLHLRDAQVTAIEIVGNALAAAPVDSLVPVRTPFDLLSGERMMVHLSDEQIDSVRITGRATSYYHVIEDGVEKGLNKVLGDTLFIAFKDRKIDRVRVASSPAASKGEFSPPKILAKPEIELQALIGRLGMEAAENKRKKEAVISDEGSGS